MIAQIVLCYDIMSSKYQIIQFAINLPPLSPNPGLQHYQTFASFFDDPFLFSLLGVADFKLFETLKSDFYIIIIFISILVM